MKILTRILEALFSLPGFIILGLILGPIVGLFAGVMIITRPLNRGARHWADQ